MNTYTAPDGRQFTMNHRTELAQMMYADLVAAIHIGQALQAKCERLEAMLENAGDLAHNLQEEVDELKRQVRDLKAEAEWAKYYAVPA